MQIIFRIIMKWLPLAIATAGLCALVYLTVQQSLRMGANDPQIQMAEDAASQLNTGMSMDSVVPSARRNLQRGSQAGDLRRVGQVGHLAARDQRFEDAGFLGYFTWGITSVSCRGAGLRPPKWPESGNLAT